MSFFQKARDRAQEAAAQFQHSMAGGSSGAASGVQSTESELGATAPQQRGSFNVTNALPHVVRHGMASLDPRYEHNRSFHLLSGRIKSARIEHEAMASQTKGMATATYQWGQDQLPEKREDSAGDDALADVSDRLAYVVSLVGSLHEEHAKRLEETRADLKRIQKLEVELAPRRALRVKIHKELMTMIPERALAHSEKIAPLEDRLKTLESEDKEREEELGKLKREALRSSFDGQFDSLIELGEKMAIVSRYGKLLLQQLPVYAPPFPCPRASTRLHGESVWPHEAKVASIRAAVEPALARYKPDLTLPDLPSADQAGALSRNSTIKFAESNQEDVAEMNKSAETETAIDGSAGGGSAINLTGDIPSLHRSSSGHSAVSPLPEGGSLPPNLNLEPTKLPERRPSIRGNPMSPPALPPRSPFDETPGWSSASRDEDGGVDAHSAAVSDGGPTFAETGSPISSADPGPKSGILSPRAKGPPAERMPMPSLPPSLASSSSAAQATSPSNASLDLPPAATAGGSLSSSAGRMTTAQAKDDEAIRERVADEQRQVAELAVAARLRRDGSIVRRGDPDWASAEKEDLPPYTE